MAGEVPMTVAQGWYADPWDAAHYRWWDGIAWTDHRQPVPAPAPVVQAVAVVAPCEPDMLVG